MKRYKISFQEDGKLYSKKCTQEEFETLRYQKNIVKIKEINRFFDQQVYFKVKLSEQLNIFTQLQMMLNAQLPLYDAIKIVYNGCKQKRLKTLLKRMQDALQSGKPIHEAFVGFEKLIDKIIIAFFQVSHLKGNSEVIVSAICRVLELKYENRKLILSTLSYPIMILMVFLLSLSIIFIFVIPKFESIFVQYNLQLPLYTAWLLSFKKFLLSYFGYFMLGVCSIYLLLKVIFTFEYYQMYYDKFILHIPIIHQIVRAYELYSFFIALHILLKCRYEFDVALYNSQLLLKNKYLLDRIQTINRSIKNGLSITEAFRKTELFDELVINLIQSGEMSSSMVEACEKIEAYYKQKFTTIIKRFASLIEPLFFVVMMLLILWVLLAIFTPIWNMSEMLNQ